MKLQSLIFMYFIKYAQRKKNMLHLYLAN